MHVSIDFETFSEAKLTGPQSVGVWNYAAHPTTRVLCMAYSIDGAVPELWTEASGEPLPEWMHDPVGFDVHYTAWNVMFEYAIIEQCLGLPTGPIEHWWDTMAVARGVALPGKLETCAQAMKLATDQQKDQRGKTLIQKLCQPYRDVVYDKPDRLELMEELYAYCIQDVVAEQSIAALLPPMSENERRVWIEDQKINYRGIPIDIPSCGYAIEMYDELRDGLDSQLVAMTGLDNPNSVQQMNDWLTRQGVDFPNMQAETIERALRDHYLELEGLEILGG